MKFSKLFVLASVVAFAACGGGDAPADTAADTTTVAAPAPDAAPAVTGTTHVVAMTSLANAFNDEDMRNWLGRIERRLPQWSIICQAKQSRLRCTTQRQAL